MSKETYIGIIDGREAIYSGNSKANIEIEFAEWGGAIHRKATKKEIEKYISMWGEIQDVDNHDNYKPSHHPPPPKIYPKPKHKE